MWCIQKIDEEYRSRMYRLLDLYKAPYDPFLPMICVDEKSKQLLKDTRIPLPANREVLRNMIMNINERERVIYLLLLNPNQEYVTVKSPIPEPKQTLHILYGNW